MATTTITVKLEPDEYSTLKFALDSYIKECHDNARVAGGTDRSSWAEQERKGQALRRKL